MKRLDTPILLIAFNRPELTRKVLECIAKVKPKQLFFAVDGPRNYIDSQKVNEVIKTIEAVDWECEVQTVFSNCNYGCKNGPIRALTWFFENVKQGIILEDDVIADESFFYFCEELLNKYKDSQEVGTICGTNFSPIKDPNHSYFFSKYSQTWGWATWRRVWKKYDQDIKSWPKLKKTKWLGGIFNNRLTTMYWKLIFNQVFNQTINSAWDYQWTFMSWVNNFLTVVPNSNLAMNIGIGDKNATHTKYNTKTINYPIYALPFPLKHPKNITTNHKMDEYIQKHNYILWKEFLMYATRKITGIQ